MTSEDILVRLFAMRQGINGVLGILAGVVVTLVLKHFSFSTNFALLFFLTYFFWLLSLSSLVFVKETARIPHTVHTLYEYFCVHVPKILRNDGNFRWYLALKASMLMSLMSFGFFSVYGIQKFNLPASAAGTFTSLYMVGQILSSFLIGPATDRYGHRLNILVFCLIVISQNLVAFLSPSIWIYYLIFPLLGANRILQIITFIVMPMEYAESQVRPTYFALSNTLTAPFYMSGMLGGWLIPQFGFTGIFSFSICFAMLALIILAWKIREPRHYMNHAEVLSGN